MTSRGVALAGLLLSRLALVCGLSLVAAGPASGGEHWPSYRGPTDQGHSDAADLPLRWSESENVAWKTPIPGKAWSSPVIWGDRIWLTNAPDDGTQLFALCVEAKTGKELWKARLGGNYSASPIYAAGRIYFFDESGKATVIEAAPEYQPLAVNRLNDGFMASPAVSGKALYLRTKTALYRIEEAGKPGS